MNVLLGVTGSVAATLTPKLVKALRDAGHELRVVATESSLYFWKSNDLFSEDGPTVYRDKDEWPASSYKTGDPVLHIELRKWADILIIAPLSANTLAKMAYGLADNLLSNVVRAWDMEKPIVVAPAMNTCMWENPVTQEHLDTLSRRYKQFHCCKPVKKVLACGDEGVGAMADIYGIVVAVEPWKRR